MLLNPLFLSLVHQFGPFKFHFSLSEWLFALFHPLDVSEGLLLDDLELFDHFRVIQVNLSLVSHVDHLLSWPAEVHIHNSDQVLTRKFHLFDRCLINLGFIDLIKLLSDLVIFDAFDDDLRQLVDLREVLQVIMDVERELFDLLLDQEFYFTIYFLHLELNLFVFDCFES